MRVRVRLLQEALAAAGCSPGATDGLHGPDTARALVLFQTRAGIRSDGAAGPETWRALRSSAGIGPRTVLMLRYDAVPEREDAYTRLGWTVRSLRSEELPDIELAVAPGPVDVVHVTASMHVAGAIPYLYFGSGTGTTARFRSESVTCGVLDAAVRRLAKQGSTPLVVLDVADRPYFDSETVRQLLLRNDFAQQLLALGHCYAVLATGLAPQAQATAARQRLLTELTTATTAADLSGSLRSDLVEGPDPGDLFPWATTALFTAVPPNQLPPLHRSGGTG